MIAVTMTQICLFGFFSAVFGGLTYIATDKLLK